MADPIKLAQDVAAKYYDDERFSDADCDNLGFSITQCHTLQSVLRNDLSRDQYTQSKSKLLSVGFPLPFANELVGVDGRKIFINYTKRYSTSVATYCDTTSPQKTDKCDKFYLSYLPHPIRAYAPNYELKYEYDIPKIDHWIHSDLHLGAEAVQRLLATIASPNHEMTYKRNAATILLLTDVSYDTVKNTLWKALPTAGDNKWHYWALLGRYKEAAADLRKYAATAKLDEARFIIYSLAIHRTLEPSDIKLHIDRTDVDFTKSSDIFFLHNMMELQDPKRLPDFLKIRYEISVKSEQKYDCASSFLFKIAATEPQKVFDFLDQHAECKANFPQEIESERLEQALENKQAFLNLWQYSDDRYKDALLSFFDGNIDAFMDESQVQDFSHDKKFRLYFPLLTLYYLQSKNPSEGDRETFVKTALKKLEQWGFPDRETTIYLFLTTNTSPWLPRDEDHLLNKFVLALTDASKIHFVKETTEVISRLFSTRHQNVALPEKTFITNDRIDDTKLEDSYLLSTSSLYLSYLLYSNAVVTPNAAATKPLLDFCSTIIKRDNLAGAIQGFWLVSAIGSQVEKADIIELFTAFLADRYVEIFKKYMASKASYQGHTLEGDAKIQMAAFYFGATLRLAYEHIREFWHDKPCGVFFDRLKKLPKGDTYRSERIALIIGVGSCFSKDHPRYKEMHDYITGPDCAKISPYVDHYIKQFIKDENDFPIEDPPEAPTPSAP